MAIHHDEHVSWHCHQCSKALNGPLCGLTCNHFVHDKFALKSLGCGETLECSKCTVKTPRPHLDWSCIEVVEKSFRSSMHGELAFGVSDPLPNAQERAGNLRGRALTTRFHPRNTASRQGRRGRIAEDMARERMDPAARAQTSGSSRRIRSPLGRVHPSRGWRQHALVGERRAHSAARVDAVAGQSGTTGPNGTVGDRDRVVEVFTRRGKKRPHPHHQRSQAKKRVLRDHSNTGSSLGNGQAHGTTNLHTVPEVCTVWLRTRRGMSFETRGSGSTNTDSA